MTLKFLPEADAELIAAINYYNEQKDGLGFEFSDEVENALKRIRQYPEAWPICTKKLDVVERTGFHMALFIK